MAIKDVLRRLIGYKLGGGQFTEMSIPPGWDYQSYLKAYGNIGWLFGAVSLIAHSVASSDWYLYHKKDDTPELIEKHPLVDLWNHVNPFQTRYQFLLQLETYVELIGEAFIVLNYNSLGVPAEMWLASPAYMKVIPSPTKYISHYEYERGDNKIRLEIPEVIHVYNVNPANPYRGIGAAKSIATDLDSEVYAAKYQNKLFYNDATPRLFLEFPDLPPAEERKRLKDEFLSVHQGWRNAYKPGFLWGGAKVNTVSLTSRDMDFAAMRNASMKVILGAYHIPDSLIGRSEVGSRARAEADEYIFSKYTVKPALQRIKEALNEQLCPLFDEGLWFEYEDPVPEDVETIRKQNREDFQAGIITREEARSAIGLDAEAEGTFLLPLNVLEVPAKYITAPKHKGLQNEQKDALWRAYAARTENEERMFINALKELWAEQQKEVLENLKTADNADEALFDRKKAEQEFHKKLLPLLTEVFELHYRDAQNLLKPQNPHEGKQVNERAVRWLKEHSLELAKLINGTTIEQLRAVLVEGFEAGESIPQITRRIIEYYGQANRVRATMVARTETIAAAVEGNIQGYEDVGVKMVEWYTALDDRTCDICMPHHEERFTVIDSHGKIPAHPQCRCVFVPLLE